MRNLIEQLLKFGIVGVVATVIDFGVMIALREGAGLTPVVASTISFCVSLVFNYVASMRFVFARRDDMGRAREFTTFLVLSLVGLGINALLMWAGTELATYDYRLVKVFATAVVMLWNFVTRKIFLERRE
ncbi:MAG TPA: GtrA family protein [Candidatus Olsenella pullistercoris]|uniref:GtrA family protein n=1 Tax=Candidatus Olsenella pullistercoris TaxID=2838712 RepID=A0A9D2JE29_9ACTN|nr:GtrA family protein [Candidatus Olsenella pullistercoris]